MRALPADSVEYFEETALGNTALPTLPVEAGAAGFGAGAVLACFGAAAGAFAVGAGAAGVEAGAADASAPHSALRKSFHFMLLSVPAVCAALYLALHSFMVSAAAGEAAPATATISVVQSKTERMHMTNLLLVHGVTRTDRQPLDPGPQRLYSRPSSTGYGSMGLCRMG